MRDFHKLKVWSKAHQLVLAIYKISADYPKDEAYGLTSQSRRAAASVASNIAEGCGKNTDPDFARFLQMAMGSASEAQYDLLLARDLGFLSITAFQMLDDNVIEVKRMLATLINKLRADS